jgi:glycerol uptake facilitator-like aquaporin
MYCTAFFISVIMAAKYFDGAKDLFLNGFVIGLTLFFCISICAGVSGGCLNPAVGLVQSLFQHIITGSKSYKIDEVPEVPLNFLWVFVAGPASGGIIAGLFTYA